MRIVSGGPPRSRYLERGAAELSREARKRLQWFDYYAGHGRDAALTCRYFGISRQTFYRWKRCYDPGALGSLEDASHRPLRRRRPTWTAEQADRVQRLRERYSLSGKRAAGSRLQFSSAMPMLSAGPTPRGNEARFMEPPLPMDSAAAEDYAGRTRNRTPAYARGCLGASVRSSQAQPSSVPVIFSNHRNAIPYSSGLQQFSGVHILDR